MPRKYILGAALLCIVIGAIAWVLTGPPLPPTTSSYLSETFRRKESPAELAFSYKLRAIVSGWMLGWQDGNTYYFYTEPQREALGETSACSTSKSLNITLIPASGGGSLV